MELGSCVKLLIFAFLSAFSSAAFGVGLGLLLSPTMLSVGLNPVKTASTEIYMAFYSTLTSTILVIIFGGLSVDYTVNLIILAIIGSIVGIWF